MAAIMHRQWSRHERLSYPMVQLPARMLDGADSPGGRILPFFRKRGMWLGFAIPFTLFSLTGLNHYYPSIPEFPFYLGWVNWFRSIDAWGEGIARSYAWLVCMRTPRKPAPRSRTWTGQLVRTRTAPVQQSGTTSYSQGTPLRFVSPLLHRASPNKSPMR